MNFIVTNSRIAESHLKKLMLDTSKLAKDVGTVLDGQETVDCGLIDAIGGMSNALAKLNEMIKTSFEIRCLLKLSICSEMQIACKRLLQTTGSSLFFMILRYE